MNKGKNRDKMNLSILENTSYHSLTKKVYGIKRKKNFLWVE